MKGKLLPIVCVLTLLGACSVPKDVAYFQGIDRLTTADLERMNQTYATTIAADDLLTINVTAWNTTVVAPFNPPPFAYIPQGETSVAADSKLTTYLVDKEGYINFPVLGKVQAAGLTKAELIDALQTRIREYVDGAMVHVQIVNFKITILGEVSRPGSVNIRNDRVSILDALGMVGDLTINANRKNILIVRDNNGRKEYGRLDVANPEIFASPYFYLKQNDVVYVEPNNAKKRNANYSSAQQYTLTIISTILTAASVITTVVVALRRK